MAGENVLKEIVANFIDNDKKWCFFAINNVCNNQCQTCSIWKEEAKIVKFKEAKEVIDKLYENNFRILQLTGGEPLINPDFFKIASYAKKLGFLVFVPTNGTLINEKIAKKIKESKIDQVSISFHHYDPSIFERITGRKGILKRVLKSIEILKRNRIPVSLLCTISKYNINDIEEIAKFVRKLDLAVSFCMPVSVKKTSFKLGGNGESVDFSKEQIRDVLLRIIKLKKHGYNVINSLDYLLDTVKYIDGNNKYNCFGGKKIFYLDWNLNVYPCMCKGKPKSINNYNFDKVRYKDCNNCIIQCFREPSIFLIKRIETLKISLKELPFIILTGSKRAKTLLKYQSIERTM